MKHSRPNMSPALRNFLIFLGAIIICAIVFTLVTILLFKGQLFDQSQTSSVLYVDQNPPQNENILLVQKRYTYDDEAERFWLLGLDFINKHLKVTALFPETLAVGGGRTDTLEGQFAYAGINHAASVVQELFGINISRYAVISRDNLISVIDWHGGIVFTPDKRISHTDPETGVTITLEAERQNLKGGQVMALLDYSYTDTVQKINIEQNLLHAFFNQYLNQTYLNYAERNFLYSIEQMNTNLSYADIHDWLPYLHEIAQKDMPCIGISLTGEFEYITNLGSVFIVSDECIQKFRQEYG